MEEAAKSRETDDLSDDLAHLVVWYQDIRARALRGYHFEPVQLSEILAYEHFLKKAGIEITAFEWDMIFRLDSIWMDCVPKEQGGKPPRREQTRH